MGIQDRDYYREEVRRKEQAVRRTASRPHSMKRAEYSVLAKTQNRPPELAAIGWQIAFGIVLLLLVLSLAKQVRPEWFDRSGRGWGGAPESTPTAAEPGASANQGKPARPLLVI